MISTTQITICILLIFTLVNLYAYIQNTQQAGVLNFLKRRYDNNEGKNDDDDSTIKFEDRTVHFKDLPAIKKQLLQEMKTGESTPFDSKIALTFSNHTLSIIDRIYKKIFPSGSDTFVKSLLDQQPKDEDLEWLDRDDAKGFAEYGDGSCPVTTDRTPWQKVLAKWIEVAKEHKIRYFLTAGSLLGAWRDEEVIPYDQDLDIRIHIDDFDKLYPLRQRKFIWESYDDYDFHFYFTKDWRLPYDLRRRYSCKGKKVEDYEGQCSFTDPTARLIYRQWHMDLYAYTYYQDTVKFIPHSAAYEYRKEDILPVTRCMFMGIETRCPQKPKVIFKNLYNSFKPTKICSNKTWVKV